jgi:hypothetical protein
LSFPQPVKSLLSGGAPFELAEKSALKALKALKAPASAISALSQPFSGAKKCELSAQSALSTRLPL